MSSERVLLSVPEGAGVCCASAPDVMRGSLTHGELMFGLMRLRPRTGDTGDLEIFLKRLVEDTRLLFGASGAAVALSYLVLFPPLNACAFTSVLAAVSTLVGVTTVAVAVCKS